MSKEPLGAPAKKNLKILKDSTNSQFSGKIISEISLTDGQERCFLWPIERSATGGASEGFWLIMMKMNSKFGSFPLCQDEGCGGRNEIHKKCLHNGESAVLMSVYKSRRRGNGLKIRFVLRQGCSDCRSITHGPQRHMAVHWKPAPSKMATYFNTAFIFAWAVTNGGLYRHYLQFASNDTSPVAITSHPEIREKFILLKSKLTPQCTKVLFEVGRLQRLVDSDLQYVISVTMSLSVKTIAVTWWKIPGSCWKIHHCRWKSNSRDSERCGNFSKFYSHVWSP